MSAWPRGSRVLAVLATSTQLLEETASVDTHCSVGEEALEHLQIGIVEQRAQLGQFHRPLMDRHNGGTGVLSTAFKLQIEMIRSNGGLCPQDVFPCPAEGLPARVVPVDPPSPCCLSLERKRLLPGRLGYNMPPLRKNLVASAPASLGIVALLAFEGKTAQMLNLVTISRRHHKKTDRTGGQGDELVPSLPWLPLLLLLLIAVVPAEEAGFWGGLTGAGEASPPASLAGEQFPQSIADMPFTTVAVPAVLWPCNWPGDNTDMRQRQPGGNR
ncbi:uncharacterized protein B0I36DRAFT_353214 [Microdochium trichocladiopsis]|uniref:Uncharacterized protein n=1 Tax=Microdochium trichocladiopsis TaxID=1682393 RepID=A0A9P9BLM0_9PEZI|nr:uncharacterized protein B0I36DRAFT_353214 [Microdochium trichocladiopsis]KAH7025047.1 hypothetical protein B0I36DRAFT_353214 [Microdochium trichocladiopsis]